MLSVVSCWLDRAELISAYESAVAGAEIIIVDTGSRPVVHEQLGEMCDRLGGALALDDAQPFSFARACNLGLMGATGDVILFLNNDITAEPGWLAEVERDALANPRALLGPSTDVRGLNGRAFLYVEGWCIAATRAVWRDLAGWDAQTYQRPYWEDVDLSWRAVQAGLRLKRRPWRVRHLGNVTSDSVPWAKDATDANRDALEAKVAEWDVPEHGGVARI